MKNWAGCTTPNFLHGTLNVNASLFRALPIPKANFDFASGITVFLKKSTLKWCGDRPHGDSKGQVPASAN